MYDSNESEFYVYFKDYSTVSPIVIEKGNSLLNLISKMLEESGSF